MTRMTRMIQTSQVLVLLAVLLSPLAAHAQDPAEIRRTIARWLECEECSDGELNAVVSLAQKAVPTLAATLRSGPSLASRQQRQLHLEQTYDQLRAQGLATNYSKPAYVQAYLANYEALYRIRSAQALGAIGGAQAKQALQTALGTHLQPDVQRAV